MMYLAASMVTFQIAASSFAIWWQLHRIADALEKGRKE